MRAEELTTWTIAISLLPMSPSHTLLAHDDSGGPGPLVLLLPGAGDVRSEHRFLAERLRQRGARVVTADLPGHGHSPLDDSYGVAQTAAAILRLIDHLDAGPAVVIGASFAPAAAVWAATERPDAITGVVAISAHMEAEHGAAAAFQRWASRALLRGPLAAPVWNRLYRSWYETVIPEDLDDEIARIEAMLADPDRRRAVRETLVAHRDGMSERLERLDVPTLVVFGSADGHFTDPSGEADRLAALMGGSAVMVDGAGHYPHVERPDVVAEAVEAFLGDLGAWHESA